MSVRLLKTDDDLAALAKLHAACFADAWDQRALGELIASGAFAVVSSEGFILVRAAGGEAEILTLAVAQAARRRGLGRELVVEAADHVHRQGATALFLEVAVTNDAARGLYSSLGFHEAGRRKGYYAGNPPADALILRADLPLSPLGKRAVER
ncbi:MAG: GNAT family N-acetyltransferase [Alphaproteobacteria bacterium]|nr:GNAT family N-acetyltransferase [Alphaproteobacteria bacterium]MBV9420504.1 GNAT family N-acetyltransferase [Alphaproteobacteria bacterium]MBV9541276.1 GNAT family N-acetyltransferase [Alphaproteobacteria bacterium]MBV9905675.1 GNAT family N-acetyltransferase [Alphaproteobacteria bacterium]